MIVKTRKQGNSLMITIPKELNVPQGKLYEVKQTPQGELIFTPQEDTTVKYSPDHEVFSDVDTMFEEYDGVFKELVER